MSPAKAHPVVLVVDDAAMIAMHVAMVVGDAPRWRCDMATSVQQALKIAAEDPHAS